MRNYFFYALLALIVVIFDQLSKHWVLNHLIAYHSSVTINDFFNIVLAKNSGAAFSLLAEASGWQRYFFTFIAAIAIIWIVSLIIKHPRNILFSSSLSLILGGAIGNLLDRIQTGVVTDFIQWHVGSHYWPSFNVADSAITIGAILLVWESLRRQQ